MGLRLSIRIKRGTNLSLLAALVLATGLAGCFNVGKKNSASDTRKKLPPIGDSAAPDKALYERAMTDINKKHYETARLELNALINTYPETDYLAKAKLAIADSFYKEGGTGNLAQAVAQYKDFITFFPMLPEAPYAQMQVAMVHYRQLAKPDRDRTEAEFAEQEFQNFLKSYPDSELAPVAAQHLREVQEELAEGDYRIASFYWSRGNLRAASGRLSDIANRYPLFSKSDNVLWMLGQISEKAPVNNLQGKDKELFIVTRTRVAAGYYMGIIQNYPLSPMVPKAKERLTALGAPIPQPNPAALARMQQEQQISRSKPGPLSHVTGLIKNGPDVSTAARVGNPNMNPPDDSGGGGETLNAALTNMNISAETGSTAGGRTDSEGGAIVAGSGSNTSATGNSANETAKPNPTIIQPAGAANSSETPKEGTSATTQPAPGTAPASGTNSAAGTNPAVATPSTAGATKPTKSSSKAQSNSCGPETADANGQGSSTTAGSTTGSTTGSTSGSSNGSGSGSNNGSSSSSSSSSSSKTSKNKKQNCGPESSSQKKSGIHKLIPW